ncbi:MAG: hypothetical protein Q9162_004965 [Coniocarpon cinnabarinum]
MAGRKRVCRPADNYDGIEERWETQLQRSWEELDLGGGAALRYVTAKDAHIKPLSNMPGSTGILGPCGICKAGAGPSQDASTPRLFYLKRCQVGLDEHEQHDMSIEAPTHAHIYPAYSFALSPTFNKWVKLTVADVHSLRALPTFQDQGIYFHLNHPIRFIYICGPIVGIRPIPDDSASIPYYVILDIDDSSGQTIEVKLRTIKSATSIEQRNGQNSLGAERRDEGTPSSEDDDETHEVAARSAALNEFVVATSVENISVTNSCSTKGCREKHVLLNDQEVRLYDVIKAKGKIVTYNEARQIELERAFLVRTTDEEMRVWEEYTEFVQKVLSRPWVLDKTALRKIERADRERAAKAAAESRERELVEQAKERKREKRREKNRLRELEEEKQRQKESAELDGNPAKTNNTKRTSIDGILVEETRADLAKASEDRPSKRLSGAASTIRRGTAVTISELEALQRPMDLPNEVMFDAEEEIIARPKPALVRTDVDQAKDANELDDADIESLVSTPRDDARASTDP